MWQDLINLNLICSIFKAYTGILPFFISFYVSVITLFAPDVKDNLVDSIGPLCFEYMNLQRVT